jgi:hypothetical protein
MPLVLNIIAASTHVVLVVFRIKYMAANEKKEQNVSQGGIGQVRVGRAAT